jgi:hypothetical protein
MHQIDFGISPSSVLKSIKIFLILYFEIGVM